MENRTVRPHLRVDVGNKHRTHVTGSKWDNDARMDSKLHGPPEILSWVLYQLAELYGAGDCNELFIIRYHIYFACFSQLLPYKAQQDLNAKLTLLKNNPISEKQYHFFFKSKMIVKRGQ